LMQINSGDAVAEEARVRCSSTHHRQAQGRRLCRRTAAARRCSQLRRRRSSTNAGDETLCRPRRPTEGHQASPRVHEIGIYLPRIPSTAMWRPPRRLQGPSIGRPCASGPLFPVATASPGGWLSKAVRRSRNDHTPAAAGTSAPLFAFVTTIGTAALAARRAGSGTPRS
jgi:hypothetical protein